MAVALAHLRTAERRHGEASFGIVTPAFTRKQISREPS